MKTSKVLDIIDMTSHTYTIDLLVVNSKKFCYFSLYIRLKKCLEKAKTFVPRSQLTAVAKQLPRTIGQSLQHRLPITITHM